MKSTKSKVTSRRSITWGICSISLFRSAGVSLVSTARGLGEIQRNVRPSYLAPFPYEFWHTQHGCSPPLHPIKRMVSNRLWHSSSNACKDCRPSETTYFGANILSCRWPLTRCPTPVPRTRRPSSTLCRILSSVPLEVKGSSSSTPCSLASFTSSACRRSEYSGSCHLPVIGCLCGRNGFGVAPSLIVFVTVDFGRIWDGGYFARKRCSLGCSCLASSTYLDTCAAIGAVDQALSERTGSLAEARCCVSRSDAATRIWEFHRQSARPI